MLFPEQQRREEKGEDSILHCKKGKEKRNLTRPAARRTFQFKGGSSRVHEMLSFKLKMNTPQPASHAGGNTPAQPGAASRNAELCLSCDKF